MLTHEALMGIATQAYGEDQGGGQWSEKDAYDAYEVAMNIYQMERLAGSGALQRDAKGAKAIVGWIERNVESQLPKQKVRDEKAGDFQQFSTPPSYAYAINWITNINENDIVLEPSAGTGNIAIFPALVVDPANLFVNEMEPSRQALLELMGFQLFKEDALQLGNILGDSLQPTVVVMNPPFSATGKRINKKQIQTGGNHVKAAFQMLAPGGRLVAIVGGGIEKKGEPKGGMSMTAPGYRKFWNDIQAVGNVRANIHVAGEVYGQFGAPYTTRVLVIDKPPEGVEPDGGEVLTAEVTSIPELIDTTEEVRNARQTQQVEVHKPSTGEEGGAGTGTEQTPTEPEGTGTTETGGQEGQQTDTGGGRPPDDKQPTPPVLGGDGGQTATGGSGSVDDEGGGTGDNGTETGTTVSPDSTDDGRPDGDSGKAPGSQDTGGGGVGTDGRSEDQDESGSQRGADGDLEDDTDVTITKEQAQQLAQEWKVDPKLKAKFFPNTKPHPALIDTPTVLIHESPDVDYQPNLPKGVIDSGALSELQLTALVYGGAANEEMIHDNKTRHGQKAV